MSATLAKSLDPSTLSGRLRFGLVALLSASIAINLVDRQVLSVVAPVLREQLHLSNTQYSYIVFAFQLGMLLGQIPAGIMLDAVGTRLGMTLLLAAWSVVNGLHSLARSLHAFLGLRLLMGLSECGNYTGGIKAIAGLFSAEHRAFAGGVFNAGAQLGSVIAPPLIVMITLRFGWPTAFLIPSLLGLVWMVPWLALFPKDRPPAASTTPSAVGVIRLGALLRNRQVRGYFFLRLLIGPLYSFYWYWLPEYLRHGRGMSFSLIGMMAWIPYLFGMFGNLGGGYVSDLLIRRGFTVDRARKTCFAVGACLSAFSMALPFIPNDSQALATICAIIFGNNWMAATYIGIVGDLFEPSVVGRVNGIAGAGDSAAGMAAMLLTGIIVDRVSYLPVLICAGVLPLAGTAIFFWLIGKIARVPIAELETRSAAS